MNWIVAPTLLLAVLLFWLGEKISQRCPSGWSRRLFWMISFLAGIPGYLFCLFYLHWFDDAVWFYQFRSIPYTELTAAGAGLFAGSISAMFERIKIVSRPFLAVLLCIGIVIPYLKPILNPLPASQFQNTWEDNVCLQSTGSSCGAASAATVFRKFGLEVQEQQIARECFTYFGGTENWYLARAFRRRGFHVQYRIEKGLPADLHTPAIAGVSIGDLGHFIAILDKTNNVYITGDPLVGQQEISAASIATKFDFTGFFMEIKRKPISE